MVYCLYINIDIVSNVICLSKPLACKIKRGMIEDTQGVNRNRKSFKPFIKIILY